MLQTCLPLCKQTRHSQCIPTKTTKQSRIDPTGSSAHADLKTQHRSYLVRNICAVGAGVVFMVDNKQNDTQEEADGAHGDVGDAQEGVLSSHPGNGA